MTDWPILSTVIFLPLVGCLLLLFMRDDTPAGRQNIMIISLVTTVVTFAVSLFVWIGFDNSNPGFQMVENYSWLARGINYHLGVDGISMLFIVLSTFLMPFGVLTSWTAITYRVRDYMIAFLVLETVILGVFASLDIVLFYVFFEASLIPMFLIIGVWGGPRRIYATFKFFLYTLLGSIFMLVAIIVVYNEVGSTAIPDILAHQYSVKMQYWLWLAFFVSFAVKVPMWPFHTWLPDAHVEAPTAGSVDLAALLLKFGGYGFLRFSLPMFPDASAYFAPMMMVLSVIAIIYASYVALMQTDIKKMIAYSSVAHMGYVTMGIFAVNQQGIHGALFQMLSHGLISGALFLCVGVIYERMHTRDITAYGGIVNSMPKYAVAFMFFTMANVGLPGTSGFVGELLTTIGIFRVSTWTAFFAATGVILSAAYMLWLYRRMIFGPITNPKIRELFDITIREKFIVYPMIAVTLFFGIYPEPVFDVSAASVDLLIHNYNAALHVTPLAPQPK
jgi:NADH-quinone oxidoreductase subunit M